MKPEIGIVARILPLSLVLPGLAFAVVAAFTPVSPQKGLRRLVASLLVGAAFAGGSTLQMFIERHLWPGAFGLAAGVFLVWLGLRKHKRDPDGRTPAAQML